MKFPLTIEEEARLKEDGSSGISGWKNKRKAKGNLNSFKTSVFTLEKEYSTFRIELDIANSNPVVYYAKLVLGIIFIAISLMWWIHMFELFLILGLSSCSLKLMDSLLTLSLIIY